MLTDKKTQKKLTDDAENNTAVVIADSNKQSINWLCYIVNNAEQYRQVRRV